jgi:hypothetical protein
VLFLDFFFFLQLDERSAANEGSGSDTDHEEAAPAPATPGAFVIAVSFVVNLFTSLIPQPPDAVNVN